MFKFCIFEKKEIKNIVLRILYDVRKCCQLFCKKKVKFHFHQLEISESLTLTLFNGIVFTFIFGHKLKYYTKTNWVLTI